MVPTPLHPPSHTRKQKDENRHSRNQEFNGFLDSTLIENVIENLRTYGFFRSRPAELRHNMKLKSLIFFCFSRCFSCATASRIGLSSDKWYLPPYIPSHALESKRIKRSTLETKNSTNSVADIR